MKHKAIRAIVRTSDILNPWVATIALIIGLAGFGYTGWTNHEAYVRQQHAFCQFAGSVGGLRPKSIPVQTTTGDDITDQLQSIVLGAHMISSQLSCPTTP